VGQVPAEFVGDVFPDAGGVLDEEGVFGFGGQLVVGCVQRRLVVGWVGGVLAGQAQLVAGGLRPLGILAQVGGECGPRDACLDGPTTRSWLT
jgi:hypothetical protein